MNDDLLDKLHMLFAWLVGIAFTFAFVLCVALALEGLKIPVFPTKTIVDEFGAEVIQVKTIAGTAIIVLGIMFGTRVGMAVFTGRWRGGNNIRQEVDFVTWAVGVFAFGFFGTLLSPFFHKREGLVWDGIHYLAIGTLAAGIFLLLKSYRNDQIARIEEHERQTKPK